MKQGVILNKKHFVFYLHLLLRNYMFRHCKNCFDTFFFQYLDRFDLAPVFTFDEFKHWFLPQSGIVDSYVVEVRFIHHGLIFFSFFNQFIKVVCKAPF